MLRTIHSRGHRPPSESGSDSEVDVCLDLSGDDACERLGTLLGGSIQAEDEFELSSGHLLGETFRGKVIRIGHETHLVGSVGPARVSNQLLWVWSVALSAYAVIATLYANAHYPSPIARRVAVATLGVWAGLMLLLHGGRQLVAHLEDCKADRLRLRRELWKSLGVPVSIPPPPRHH